MTTFDQPAMDFDATPDEATIATVADVSTRESRCEVDYAWFETACRSVAQMRRANDHWEWVVDPNKVRDELDGSVEPRRLSSFWLRATGKNGFLDNTTEWVKNTDTKGRNSGKPIRLRRLRT